jgi:hypothetical protein
MKKNKIIEQNSFTEFLLYTTPNGKVKVEIFLKDENIWLTQKRIAELFDVEVNTVNYHLTANDGKNYETNFYNLNEHGLEYSGN